MDHKFRVSSALKDVIGRDLITNDFVAVFELVKNSFDAHATKVRIEFQTDSIIIADNGKGMSRDDITSKWLFVAYSAKRTDEEDQNLPRDYRDGISQRRGYAGNKGIGRFSCDRLGERLQLFSRFVSGKTVECLTVDWASFERDAKQEFADVDVSLDTVPSFPKFKRISAPPKNGTVLVIDGLRSEWDFSQIDRLRTYLAKLVDPFEGSKRLSIETFVADTDPDEDWSDVEGPVGNNIVDLLSDKTTRIEVEISGGTITSSLYDRGSRIYQVEEVSPYGALLGATVNGNVYYLNRSAKHTFTSRMGIQPVGFGNMFLFVNGFRIFPVGEPTDDTFGIARRKQQGTARYFGLRDILGKIDVDAPQGMFVEASSRDAGLIQNEAAEQLVDAAVRHMVQRLERYVVNVSWPDRLDQDRDDASGLGSDTARSRVIRVVQALAGSKNVTLLDYNSELIDIVNERSENFEESMAGLRILAKETGNGELLAKIAKSQQRYEELKAAEEEAREQAREEAEARRQAEEKAAAAESRADQAVALATRLETQNRLLSNLQGQENEELTLLHHQVIIYATEVRNLVDRSMRKLSATTFDADELGSNLEQISFQISRILGVTRLATRASFKMNADVLEADIIQFLQEYVEEVAGTIGDVAEASFSTNGISLLRKFKPIDMSIVVDNLFANSSKARASRIHFECRKPKSGKGAEIVVSDNGRGIDPRTVDSSKIFEKSYSGSKKGSGLGLYHVRQVLENAGGSISLDPEREGDRATFIIRLV